MMVSAIIFEPKVATGPMSRKDVYKRQQLDFMLPLHNQPLCFQAFNRTADTGTGISKIDSDINLAYDPLLLFQYIDDLQIFLLRDSKHHLSLIHI